MNIGDTLTTPNAVWIATTLLQQTHKDRDAFQPREIFKKMRELKLVQTADVTLLAHISTHCVANTKAVPATHRKLFRVSPGWYRLYKNGDECDPTREGGISAPPPNEIPAKYRNLIEWYNQKYNIGGKEKNSKTPNLLFTSLEKDGMLKLPQNILSKLHLEEGDYVAFVENPIGGITLRKLKMQVE